MTKVRALKFITFLGVFLPLIIKADDAGNQRAALLAGLTNHYAITECNWFGKAQKPGTILSVVQEGIKVDPIKTDLLVGWTKPVRPTIIEGGKITKAGGGDALFGQGGRLLKTGDKLYVYDIKVKDDNVLFLIATVDTIDIQVKGRSEAVAQAAAVSFQMDTTSTNVTPENVIAAVKPWLAADTEAASVSTVSLGQTTVEVEKILGQPDKIANLGTKIIYYFKDMKVIFTDGKVTDVQ
jgi:hypothetical protein